ncbi:MAG: hypothetical protein ACE5IZ_04610 [Dehalococcoidia bacterium]
MRLVRDPREFLTDGLMTLALIHVCAPATAAGDRLKVAKLLFVATYDLFKERAKGFNYSFYRYSYGPFTTELYETWEDLSWTGLLQVEPGPKGSISVTAKGRELADAFINEVLSDKVNEHFLLVMHKVQDLYAGDDTGTLLRKIYQMRVRPLGWEEVITVGEAPLGVHFTRILDESEARTVVQVPTRWLRRLDAYRQSSRREPAGIEPVISDKVLDLIEEALEAESRGEGRVVDVEEIRKRYGI